MRHLEEYAFFFAWIIALIGCCVSIYFREILHIEPCALCWYQRMALFPLTLILGIALFRGDKKIFVYVIPFSLFGFLLATYQVLGGYFPILFFTSLCGEIHQCASRFLAFPIFSGIGFALISILLLFGRKPRT